MFTGEKEIYVDPSGNWETCLIMDQTGNFKIFTSTAKDTIEKIYDLIFNLIWYFKEIKHLNYDLFLRTEF